MKTYGVIAALLTLLACQFSSAQATSVLVPNPEQGAVVLTVREIPAGGAPQPAVIPASFGNQTPGRGVNTPANYRARDAQEILRDMYREKHEIPFWKK